MQNQKTSTDFDWTIAKMVQWAKTYFAKHDIDSPRTAAEILLAHTLKVERIDLYLKYDQPLESEELKIFKALIKRRIAREPLAYITGIKEFWSLDFAVTPDVLIPRPETECLVEAASDFLARDSKQSGQRILDLGTGTGAIIVAIASQYTHQHYFASDISTRALAVARCNAQRNNLSGKIQFVAGDWFTPFRSQSEVFNMIVSNPPYIPSADIAELQPEIHCFEPRLALDGQQDGLDCYRAIIRCAHLYLKQDGLLLLEIGYNQKNDVLQIAGEDGNWEDFGGAKDYGGRDRVVWMKKKVVAVPD